MSEERLNSALKLIAKMHATLEMYGESSRYTTMEVPSCGITVAVDDGGELARQMCIEAEEAVIELGMNDFDLYEVQS